MDLKSVSKPLGVIVAVLLLMSVGLSRADDNLLFNGDLTQGSLNDPLDWRTDSLRHDPKAFSWIHPPGAPGELQIKGIPSDFAQWSQKLRVTPGWYRLSGELRTEAVQPGHGSVSIGITVNGTTLTLPIEGQSFTHWTVGALYFRVGAPLEIQVVCLMAGSSGTARFRRLRLVATAAPTSDANQVDLEAMLAQRARLARSSPPHPFAYPHGSPWTVPAAIGALVAITLCGWMGFKSDWLG